MVHGRRRLVVLGTAVWIAILVAQRVPSAATPFPDPALDDALAATPAQATAVLAGGCFWGIEAVFEHVGGVLDAVSGYSGGSAATASYDMVSSDRTNHAEAVLVRFDPSRVSYGQLLKVFFSVAHNPTEVNRQGPDVGRQYRSAIFYGSERQRQIASAYVGQLDEAKVFRRRIATALSALEAFYPAEGYHQDYAARNPFAPYIVINDLPKVEQLKKQHPTLYVAPGKRRR